MQRVQCLRRLKGFKVVSMLRDSELRVSGLRVPMLRVSCFAFQRLDG
jgi:hypothetical protein